MTASGSMNALTKKSAVLYHYPCPDGAFAALAAHLYFSAASLPVLFFPNTVYNPIRSDGLPLHEVGDVYLLDYVGPSGFVADISSKVESVTVLDHHKTAFDSLCGDQLVPKNVTKVIDMNCSGATISFDYFKEKLSSRASLMDSGSTRPMSEFLSDSKHAKVHNLFKYIEDGDLWRWQLPHSKAFSSGLKDLNLEFDVNANPALFDQLLGLDHEHVIALGQETLSHKQKLIDEVLECSYRIALGNGQFGQCLAVDADSISNLRSELGNQLAEKSRNMGLRGIGAVVYKVSEIHNDEMLKISLRSLGYEDTTAISQEYGGGGHRNASSFMLSTASFHSWKIQGAPHVQAPE